MENIADFIINPTVLVAVFIGGSALLLVYILKLFKIEHNALEKNQSEQSAANPERKNPAPGKQKKKQTWVRSGDKQPPWNFKTLKGHTGQVHHINYSSSGKYLSSCADEEADPDPDMNSSSGSECNKENNGPASGDPNPRKKLSRRQRKNRSRADSSPDDKKKVRRDDSSPDEKKKKNETISQVQQFVPLTQYVKLNISEQRFASLLYAHLLTYEQMFVMGYPVPSPSHNNSIVFFHYNNFEPSRFDVNAREFVPKKILSDLTDNQSSDSSETDESSGSEPDLCLYKPMRINNFREEGTQRTCVRCGLGFFTTNKQYLTQERCLYHWGKLLTVHNGDFRQGAKQWTCCSNEASAVGCTTCKLHVWNGVTPGMNGPCEEYVKTRPKKYVPPEGHFGVYALDCEMCYTVAGMEVTKVTVVGIDGRTVYDTYVQPPNEIIDYNTRFSGITKEHLQSASAKTLKDVQRDLRQIISAQTILIGHGLENDLRALKIVHKCVVDTAGSFPHFNGLPYKRSLKSLVSAYLKREVQQSSDGHDSCEDARACMELMLYKVRKENRGYLV